MGLKQDMVLSRDQYIELVRSLEGKELPKELSFEGFLCSRVYEAGYCAGVKATTTRAKELLTNLEAMANGV